MTGNNPGTGWFLGSSTSSKARDSLDFPVEVKPNQSINGAVITFVDCQSELTGTIVNERAQPVPDYTLIVYPAEQRFWAPQSRRIQSARPATDGRFTFRNLPAGDYRLVPVTTPSRGRGSIPPFCCSSERVGPRDDCRGREEGTAPPRARRRWLTAEASGDRR